MKKLFLLLFCLNSTIQVFSQDIEGSWNGELNVFGNKLPLVFHFENENGEYSGKMDSPAQQANGIPIDRVSFKNDSLFLELPGLQISYSAILQEDSTTFSGEFKQSGMKFPFDIKRIDPEDETSSVLKRPQEPKKPYPYQSEEVVFSNKKEGFDLAGTLTLPDSRGKFPAVILITGSGPQDRNEEIMGHKPFLIIADYLTRNGIAVLRYDDRGVAESGGNFSNSTTKDFAEDALAAFEFLKKYKQIDSKKIGLIGHSEGGLVAIKSAAKNKKIAFIGLLASSTMDGGNILIKQQEDIGRASGLSENYISENKKVNTSAYELIRQIKDSTELRKELHQHFKKALNEFPDLNTAKSQGIDDQEYIEKLLEIYTDVWMRYFITYDPLEDLKKIDVPIFALNGDRDLQVNAEQNLNILRSISKSKKNPIAVHELSGLNHLFQESKTGNPNEYGLIEETFSPKALEIILEEIKNIVED